VLLSELIEGAAPAVAIRGLTADSRAVRPGYLFAALAGSRADGIAFVGEAVDRGAACILVAAERAAEVAAPVPVIADPNPRRRLALMAARFYGAQPATVAAVTGTSGKTSVAAFTRQIWQRLGHRAAALGTLGITGEGLGESLAHTTPDPVALHRALAEIAAAGVDHLAIEASSHGLDQCRLDGVAIAAAAFTNLSQDHLDYHPDAQAYLAAKRRLFEVLLAPGGTAVVNRQAPALAAIAAICRKRDLGLLTYGRGEADIALEAIAAAPAGQRLTVATAAGRREIDFPLPGAFQAENALCAAALVHATGTPLGEALAALPHLAGVPGRLQRVATSAAGAPVFVDYAHKPDALRVVLETLRAHTPGRLFVVFGCGGDRDRAKRPMMGAIAARLADVVIVTDDNPRSENAAAIRRAILAGCPGASEIGDRAEAIAAAIAEAGPDDLVLIAGKGHERGQIVGDRVLSFDDAEVVRAIVHAEEGGR